MNLVINSEKGITLLNRDKVKRLIEPSASVSIWPTTFGVDQPNISINSTKPKSPP